MIKNLLLLVSFLLLVSCYLFAEGSKQLTPNNSSSPLTDSNNDKAGYLAHDANFPSAAGVSISSLSFLKPTGFSRNGATYSKDHRLYIRVKAGETLYYGVHRTIHEQTTANQSDLIITMRRTIAATGADDAVYSVSNTLTRSNNSTRQMLLNTNQNGVIDNATQANVGPNRGVIGGKAAVTTGYAPLTITNNTSTDYDYYVEFTQVGEANMADGQRFSVYDYWDFTVIDAGGNEKPGRMRSKLWSFSSGGTTNVFSRNFNLFPLIPSEDQTGKYFVKKIELAGIAPQNFFRFVTNSFGSNTTVGAAYEERRKSQNSQSDYPEFFNFVNNPDATEWPSATAPAFNITSITNSCNPATNGGKTVIAYNSSERSTLIVLVDLNGTAGYQPGTIDVLLEQRSLAGTRTLEWNGLNGTGQIVAKNTPLRYYFLNANAPINFPMWDAEVNDGFRVEDIRPFVGSNYNSLLFWDDRNLSSTLFPAPQSELFGKYATDTKGVHAFGSAVTTASNYNAGDLKTVNTWSYGYTNALDQSATFTYDCSADVAVTNTVSAGPYTIGKNMTYTVVVTNNGPIAATNVAVTDLLDGTKLQFVSASDAAYNSSSGVWSVGSLVVGASKTLILTAKPLVTGDISATATQTHTEADNVSTNNAATTTINVAPAADIAVTNTVPQTTFNNGDLVTYTITAKNQGPNNATGVVVNDKLPAAFASNTITYAAPSGTTYDPTTGDWNVGNLGVNETKTITITGKVAQLGSITNTATLADRTGFQLDENSGNNTASNTIIISPSADLQVTSSVSNATPNQNDDIVYTIKVSNNGPNNATSVVVANQVAVGLTVMGFVSTSGTVNTATGEWNVGTVLTGTTQTLTVYARPANTGTVTVSAATQTHAEYDRVPGNNSTVTTIEVGATADVAVTNTVSPPANGNQYANEPVTYTVVVTNKGPSTATNVSIKDQLPASLSYISSTVSGTTGTYDPITGNWAVGNLTNGASATLTIKAQINQSAVITTTATQTHTEYDNVNGNNSASTSIQSGTGTITADINVLTSTNTIDYHTGDLITYTARATNQGPDGANDFKILAPLPASFTFLSSTPKVGTYDQGTGIWTIPTLASGSFTELFLTGLINPNANEAGDINYTFTAARTGTFNEVDNDATDNSHTTSVKVAKNADVSTSISVRSNSLDGNYYNQVTEATFQFTVTNNGLDQVTNLIVTDTRSSNLNFTDYVTPTGTSYNPATGSWTVGALAPFESKTLTLKGIPTTTGRLSLGTEITSADQYDGRVENNKDVALLNVLPVADVVVTNTAPPTFNNGETTTFTIKVQNNGPDAATNVIIQDVLPAGLTLVNAVTSTGSFNNSNGLWILGTDLIPGAANAQTMTLTVKPQAASSYTTTAKVYGAGEYDNIPANNSETVTIQGNASADIAVTNTLTPGPYYIGETYSVTVTATNNGPDVATGIRIGAQIAAGLRVVGGTVTPDAGTSMDSGNGNWLIPNLGVNETKNLTFSFRPIQTGIHNNIGYKIASAEYDPNGGNTTNGNNSTVVNLSVTDRSAVVQVLLNNKHYYFFSTGQHIATISDPDGAIQNTRFISGTKDGVALTALPAGVRLLSNGELEVAYKFSLQPGTYALTIETVDASGGTTQNIVNYTVSNDWDLDGVADDIDLDDNNDGIITEPGAVNPTGDDDNDGIYNFLDKNFVHPVFGVFRDRNGDDINDAFDIDLDGLLRGFDIDIDGDGLPNAIEAYGGKIPPGDFYDPVTGKIKGSVNARGIPLAILKAGTDNQSIVPPLDSDGDTRRDYEDIDADNDGLADNVEVQLTSTFINRLGNDNDVDGLDNSYDGSCGCTTTGTAIMPVDFDMDGKFDYLDLDSDDDNLPDYIEAFDDNQNGFSLDDLQNRAANFENVQQKGWYTTADADKDGIPDWMELVDNIPAYLKYSSTNTYYHDSDKNGLVDLFDSQSGGRVATLQLNSTDNQYYFRSGVKPIILPVTLVTFSGKYQQGKVVLTWATASEENNAYFVIEKSRDGVNFLEIGRVSGAGNSRELLTYTFPDSEFAKGNNYYRLKQVDFDGKAEYSKIIAVKTYLQADRTEKISLFPNPAPEFIYLNTSELPNEPVQVTIINMAGQVVLVKEIPGGSTTKIDIRILAAGHYVVRVISNSFAKTLPFIKE